MRLQSKVMTGRGGFLHDDIAMGLVECPTMGDGGMRTSMSTEVGLGKSTVDMPKIKSMLELLEM